MRMAGSGWSCAPIIRRSGSSRKQFCLRDNAYGWMLAKMRIVIALILLCASQTLIAQQPIAIAHVTVIDGTDSIPRRDQTVLIRGTKIAAVGPSRTIVVPQGARVVDGRGKFLIPGLWDMHVHTAVPDGRNVLALYV